MESRQSARAHGFRWAGLCSCEQAVVTCRQAEPDMKSHRIRWDRMRSGDGMSFVSMGYEHAISDEIGWDLMGSNEITHVFYRPTIFRAGWGRPEKRLGQRRGKLGVT